MHYDWADKLEYWEMCCGLHWHFSLSPFFCLTLSLPFSNEQLQIQSFFLSSHHSLLATIGRYIDLIADSVAFSYCKEWYHQLVVHLCASFSFSSPLPHIFSVSLLFFSSVVLSADLLLSTSLTSFRLVSPPPASLSVFLPPSCLCGCDG